MIQDNKEITDSDSKTKMMTTVDNIKKTHYTWLQLCIPALTEGLYMGKKVWCLKKTQNNTLIVTYKTKNWVG